MSDDIYDFQNKLSIEKKCKEFAEGLRKEISNELKIPAPSNGQHSIVVGFHIRHVLDPNAPTVQISYDGKSPLTSPPDAYFTLPDGQYWKHPEGILKQNAIASLQTLNHVIDTLYYDSKGSNGDHGETVYQSGRLATPEKRRLLVWIDFLKDCSKELEGKTTEAGCHKFDRVIESYIIQPDWTRAHFAVCKAAFGDNDRDHVASFASYRTTQDDEGYGDDHLFGDYVCGAEKFCKDLNIPHSLSGYRVLTSAVYQLGRYACQGEQSEQRPRFGPNTITALIRSESALGAVFGVTVIFDIENAGILKSPEEKRDVLEKLLIDFLEDKWDEFVDSRFHFPKSELFSHKGRDTEWQKIEDSVWGASWGQQVTRESQLAERLRDRILAIGQIRADAGYVERCTPPAQGLLSREWDKWKNLVLRPIHAFLEMLQRYAGERLEGRFLTFGFVLGNPQLLTHTPRERPFPITKSPDRDSLRFFFTREQLIKQVHLLAAPEDRAIVIPYSRCDGDGPGPKGKIAAHLLEFDEAMEEFRTKEWAVLWRDVFVPYLYYTERFPWAVAGFVGPGAQVRIFVDRMIVAYHDEKGWWDISIEEKVCSVCLEIMAVKGIPDVDPEEVNNDEKRNKIFKTVDSLISVALQMSRFANPDAKGGMIVWLAGENLNGWDPLSPHPELQPHAWNSWNTVDVGEQQGSLDPLTENLNASEPMRDPLCGKPWLRGKSLTDGRGKLDYTTAKLVLQAAKQDGAILVKERQKISLNVQKKGIQCPSVKDNVVVAFGQRIIARSSINEIEDLGGTRRAAARALMKGDNPSVPPGSFVISVSSDGPLNIWVKKSDGDPAECTIGEYQES